MKTFFVTLAAISLALIIGCQENMLNEPGPEISLDKTATDTNRNMLKLCCQVQDPLSGTCNLNGSVTYVHQVINRAMNPLSSKVIALHLNINASLNDIAGIANLEWRIEGRSYDLVSVSEEGILLLDKTYSITNRNDVVLLVQYLVTTDGVGISGVTIVPIEK
jgi:hypothetical protein